MMLKSVKELEWGNIFNFSKGNLFQLEETFRGKKWFL